jgi:hypothetical protein
LARVPRPTPQPQNEPRQDAEPEEPSGRPTTEYRTINERLVPFTAAGPLGGFMRFPGWPRRPVRTEPLPTTLSVAQCSETFSVAYSFSLRFVDADLLEDKGDDYLKTAIERTKQE